VSFRVPNRHIGHGYFVELSNEVVLAPRAIALYVPPHRIRHSHQSGLNLKRGALGCMVALIEVGKDSGERIPYARQEHTRSSRYKYVIDEGCIPDDTHTAGSERARQGQVHGVGLPTEKLQGLIMYRIMCIDGDSTSATCRRVSSFMSLPAVFPNHNYPAHRPFVRPWKETTP